MNYYIVKICVDCCKICGFKESSEGKTIAIPLLHVIHIIVQMITNYYIGRGVTKAQKVIT